MSVSGGSGSVSTRNQFLGINYATDTKVGVQLLGSKGVDAAGAKHLTRDERFNMMKEGRESARFSVGDAVNRFQSSQANTRARATYQNAAKGGTITRFEDKQIAGAGRDA